MFINYIRLNELKKVQTKIKELQEQRSEYISIPWRSYAAKDSCTSNMKAKDDLSYCLYSFLSGRISYEELTGRLMDYKINPDTLTKLGHYLINYGENQKYVELIDEEIQTLRRRENNLKDALGIK